MRNADIPTTRYRIAFVCRSTGNCDEVEVDGYSVHDARNRFLRGSQVRIDILSTVPVGRGGQNRE